MKLPVFEELEPEFKQVLDPSKPKLLTLIAKGMAPVQPPIMVGAWCYLSQHSETEIQSSALKSLQDFPKKNLISALSPQFPGWAIYILYKTFKTDDEVLEALLLHPHCPLGVFLELAPICSEKLTVIISNNQERIIESPEIVPALESNPANLKSNTDRLRQFLKLAGVFVPGDTAAVSAEPAKESEVNKDAAADQAALADEEVLSEEKRMSLQQYILGLNVGARVKLAVKGNKEARNILIRDTNKTVALAVLKSPRINEIEIVHYAGLKSVSEDVIRAICRTPGWTKLYPVKLNLVNHPKTPVQDSLQYIRFLNLRDLQQVTKSKTIPLPIRKAAKELLNVKRK